MTSFRDRGFIYPVLEAKPERRRYGRVRLDEPLRSRLGDVHARVLELSVVGLLVAHEGRLAPGTTQPLAVEWDASEIELECNIVRSRLHRLSKNMGEKSVYHTGLRIVRFARDDFYRLRHLIADRVMRALEEMKANAHGLPPMAAYMYQPEKGELFRRCEYVDGTWRKTETIRPQQPSNGFTIAADVDPLHVQMLCDTWEHTNAEGRRLTQMLAELSVSNEEGVPTRRYVP